MLVILDSERDKEQTLLDNLKEAHRNYHDGYMQTQGRSPPLEVCECISGPTASKFG